MAKIKGLVINCCIAFLLVGCVSTSRHTHELGGDTHQVETPVTAHLREQEKHLAAMHNKRMHWAYAGVAGPENWASLNDEYVLCGFGKNQSPIDIVDPIESELETFSYNYHPSEYQVLNTGRHIEVHLEATSYILLGDKKYYLNEIDFHIPSEHRVMGKSYPLEAQFFHSDNADNVTIVTVLFDLGRADRALDKLIPQIPVKATGIKTGEKYFNPRYLLTDATKFFKYMGSLTHPPCTEKVTWYVLREHAHISEEQLAHLRKYINNNVRPLQALNERHVEYR